LSFFDIFDEDDEEVQSEKRAEEKEKRVQKTLIEIKNKYGKNAIVKGMNLEEGATAMERNKQVGGHKA
jgi:DNA polymerase V